MRATLLFLAASSVAGFRLPPPASRPLRHERARVARAQADTEEQIVTFSDNALAQLAELREKQVLNEIRCGRP